MDAIMFALFVGLGCSIILLIVLAFISTWQKKRRGDYDSLDPYKNRRDRSESKVITPRVTEKTITLWQVFHTWSQYWKRRDAYAKDRERLADHASKITDYKKRSKAFREMSKDRFRYRFNIPKHLIPQN